MSRHPRGQSSFRDTLWSRRSIAKRRSAIGIFPFRRRLRIEPLEDRRLLATITVDTLADGIGVPGTSLREAIAAAIANDTINFSATGTINLTNLGHLLVNKSLTISGPGADLLTINAFDPTPTVNNGDGSRVFYINAPGLANVTVSGLTLTGGDVNSSGGAISNSETLTIRDSVITGNVGVHASSRGGGIAHFFGALTIERTTISDNFATISGGGVSADHATAVHVIDSTISGNQAASGGGIYGYYSYNMNVVGSTISGNRATLAGGGVGLFYGSLSARHSTIAANRADSDDNATGSGGGALVGSSSTLGLFHTIVAENFRGTGATRSDVFGAVTADFSLIGDNTNAIVTNVGGTSQVGTGAVPIDAKLGPLASNGGRTETHGLLAGSPAIDSGQLGIVSPPANDQRGAPFVRIFDGDGVGGARIDMGAYERQTLAASSFVVDTLVDEDDADYSAGDRSLREVISLAHGSSGAETITFAAALMSGGPATILLTQGELAIRDSLTIDGPGAGLLTIDASGNDPTPDEDNFDGSRVFNVDDAINSAVDNGILINVAISGLTLTGGDTGFNGGAIRTRENLTVTSSVITGNAVTSNGGGIYNTFGTLTVSNSTIRRNFAFFGGGIANIDGDAVIDRSTIANNRADRPYGGEGGGIFTHEGNLTITSSVISGNISEDGGGIHSYTNLTGTQTTTIINSTISGNLATTAGLGGAEGGGVYNDHGLTIIRHSTITNNTAPAGLGSGVLSKADGTARTEVHSTIISGNTNSDVDFVEGFDNSFQSNGFNLIGTGNALGDFNQSGDQTGVANPMLTQLSDHGGPSQTHALLPLSPAIDAGNPTAVAGVGDVPLFDQRGTSFTRVFDGDGAGGARIDIGAFEKQNPGTPQSFIVDTLADEVNGDYSAGDFSLREAIGLANANFFVADSISFAPSLAGGTILLTLGELEITDSLTVTGLGAALLTIDASGNDLTPALDNGDGSRVVAVSDFTPTLIDVELVGLTLTGGDVDGGGGGVASAERLTVIDSVVSANAATAGGGGIVSFNGELIVSGSTISNNTAMADGGGVVGVNGPVTIESSTVTGNTTDENGGGIVSYIGALTIVNSTVSGNSSTNDGGGIYKYGTGNLAITGSTISGNDAFQGGGVFSETPAGFKTDILNSTFSDNTASDVGGAIFNSSGQLDIRHSTITAPNSFNPGGGVASRGNNGTQTNVFASIIANNNGEDVRFVDGMTNSFVSLGFNMVGFGNAASGPMNAFTNFGDQIGVDPMLTFQLEDHGGPTKIHMPLPGSPVIDAGPPANTVGLPFFDQRGFPFIRAFNGDGMPGSQVDIGAYEVQTVANLTLVVDTLVDESDGNYAAGDLSLREAIGLANGSLGTNTITFAPALTSGGPATILLTHGEFQILESLTITGPEAALLAIDASGNDPTPDENNGDGSGIFDVNNSFSGDMSVVLTVNALTLTGGDAHTGGGAIDSHKTVLLNNCTISGNSANRGGGIYVDDGTVTLNNCTVVGNHARDDGGGIYEEDGTTFINSSVIHGNTAVDRGGGIINLEKVVITASTISGNTAPVGGGIFSQTNFLGNEYTTITNSTISGNTATNRGGGLYSIEGITTIRFSTISDNYAPNGMGSGVASHGNADTRTEVYSTIIAANDNSDVDFVNGGSNSFDSQGFNLVGTGNATLSPLNAFNQPGDQVGVNPLLGPLADNGGPTMTHEILTGSPAIDAGDPAALAGMGGIPMFDQRSAPFTRVFNGDGAGGPRIDVGAFELQPLPATFFGDYNQNGVVDSADYVVWRKTLGTIGVPAYSSADGDGDGTIDQDDYGVWRARFGMTAPLPAAGSGATALAFSQPAFEDVGDVTISARAETTASSVGAKLDVAGGVGLAMLDSHSVPHDSASRPLEWITTSGVAEPTAENLLLVLAIDRAERFVCQDFTGSGGDGNDEHPADELDIQDPINRPLRVALADWL